MQSTTALITYLIDSFCMLHVISRFYILLAHVYIAHFLWLAITLPVIAREFNLCCAIRFLLNSEYGLLSLQIHFVHRKG